MRLIIIIITFSIAHFVGMKGYNRARKEGSRVPLGMYAFYFGMTCVLIELLAIFLNSIGAYPR